MITLHPLRGLGEIHAGADLTRLLAEALDQGGVGPALPDDVLVITSKIVSKAEGRMVSLADVGVSPEAQDLAERTRKDPRLVQLVLENSTEIVRAVPNVLIARTPFGLVLANAGIDRSNIGAGDEERALLLPEDPDASAERIRADLQRHRGTAPGIVISDSAGRPWRNGVVNIAIGVAGLPALVDRRGEMDRDGRALEVTQVALGDMLSTAAGLAMGEGAEGIPAVLVRGVPLPEGPSPATTLIRPLEMDLFR
jgi:coenzyme F420-0:L-glutamate ligase / coenzyme F420-1:gamma-L-glutamate ligase